MIMLKPEIGDGECQMDEKLFLRLTDAQFP